VVEHSSVTTLHKCCKVRNCTMVDEKFPIIPHLHVLSQDENIHICQSIVDKTQALCPPVTDDVVVICDHFITASRLFGRCHNIYSTADSMEDEITQLGIIIDDKALLDELSMKTCEFLHNRNKHWGVSHLLPD